MSTTTTTLAPVGLGSTDRAIINGTYATVNLTTRNSTYVLVVRRDFVTLVKTTSTDPAYPAGHVTSGATCTALNNTLYVWDEDGRMVFRSSTVLSAFVMEN